MAEALLVERSAGPAGRGLFPTKPLAIGTVLHWSRPYVAVLRCQLLTQRCSECFKECGELLRCSRCKFARYCSPACQKAAWAEHREECSDIVRLHPRHPTDTVLLTARLLRKRKADPQGYAEVMHLRTYREHYGQEQLETFFQLATLILDFVSEEYRTNIDEIVDTLCKFKTNNFSISDPEMRAVGAGLYPFASLINHSCCATAVAVFTAREVCIRSIVPLQPDTQVTLSYIEIATPTETRRRELKNTWFFECTCEYCSMTTPAALSRDALLTAQISPCMHNNSNNSTCEQCKEMRTRITQLLAAGQKEKDLGKLREAYTMARKLMPASGWLALEVAQAVQSAAIESGEWVVAMTASKEVCQVFEAVYPPHWPLTGLQLAMVAKLEKLLGNRESEQHFRKALAILEVTHGADHELVRSLRELLSEVVAESEYYFNTRALT